MKKTYLMPSQLVCELQSTSGMMVPLSLQGGSSADENAEVLVKEFLFEEDEDENGTIHNPKFFD